MHNMMVEERVEKSKLKIATFTKYQIYEEKGISLRTMRRRPASLIGTKSIMISLATLMLMILIMLCVRTKSFKNGGASFSKLSCH